MPYVSITVSVATQWLWGVNKDTTCDDWKFIRASAGIFNIVLGWSKR